MTYDLRAKLKRGENDRDWAIDDDYVQHNDSYSTWLRDLPEDLRITHLDDASPFLIPSHFVGNLHCLHYISLIIHHRPQLHVLLDTHDGAWKQQMVLCYAAVRNICRLHEAVTQSHGLLGLTYPNRGISSAIYTILTCIPLHLVKSRVDDMLGLDADLPQMAMNSLDPEVHGGTKALFVRHMRVLEQCVLIWRMPEIQTQVDTFRRILSADTNKPFELKPGWTFSSPAAAGPPGPWTSACDMMFQAPIGANYSTSAFALPTSAINWEHDIESPLSVGQAQPQASPSPGTDSEHVQQWNLGPTFE